MAIVPRCLLVKLSQPLIRNNASPAIRFSRSRNALDASISDDRSHRESNGHSKIRSVSISQREIPVAADGADAAGPVGWGDEGGRGSAASACSERKRLEDPGADVCGAAFRGRRRRKPEETAFPAGEKKKRRGNKRKNGEKKKEKEGERREGEKRPCLFPNGFYVRRGSRRSFAFSRWRRGRCRAGGLSRFPRE